MFNTESHISGFALRSLRDWQSKQSLRQLWNEGIASGSAGKFSIDKFLKEAHRRHHADKTRS